MQAFQRTYQCIDDEKSDFQEYYEWLVKIQTGRNPYNDTEVNGNMFDTKIFNNLYS